tara:strand:- start:1142 stop:1288 length:147 start_codon:yes stop_codon:yes gene_type:complete
MPDEVIRPKDGLKSCMFTVGFAILTFIIIAIVYLIYVFYIDDSLDFGL